MNQSKTTLFRSRNLKGLVFLSPDKHYQLEKFSANGFLQLGTDNYRDNFQANSLVIQYRFQLSTSVFGRHCLSTPRVFWNISRSFSAYPGQKVGFLMEANLQKKNTNQNL